MKKKIFLIIIILILLFLFGVLLFGFYISSVRIYSLNLIEEKLNDSNISIFLPKQWSVIEVKEIYEKKTGCERYLIVKGVNPGGFPQLEIYTIVFDESDNKEIYLGDLIKWNTARIEERKNEDIDILFEELIDYFDGKLLTYKESSQNKSKFYQYELCKDWITVFDHTGYIVSICDFKKQWDRLDQIYPDIIESFTILDEEK